MTIHAGYLVDFRTIQFDETAESATSWIQAMPLGKYQHPLHGEIDITPERVQRFADNVKANVRETELDIDYDHKAHGGDAAGWVRDAEPRADGLWILVEWTKSAYGKIKERAYRYFSPEFVDEWTHPKTKKAFKDVLFGGGITNRPFLKDILPINMTEVINHASGGTSMDPAEVLKQLAALFGLPEDTDPAVLLGHVTAKVQPPDQQKQDQNQQDQQAQGHQGPPQHQQVAADEKQTEGGKPPVQLTETQLMEMPFVKQLMETVTAQGKKLDEDSVKNDVIKLNELASSKNVAIPPVLKEGLEKQLSDLPPAARPALVKLFETAIESGSLGVKLGEDGHSGHSESGAGTATKKFNDAIDKKMESEKGISFMDAALAVANDDPQLYTSYQHELAGSN